MQLNSTIRSSRSPSPQVSFSPMNRPSTTPEDKISQLCHHLSPKSLEFFDPIINICSIGNTERCQNYILGDADGSVGRILLIAVQCKYVQLNKNDLIEDLAFILNKEAEAIGESDAMKRIDFVHNFQSSFVIAQKILNLVKNADYLHPQNEFRRLIFIGDILHDRLTNHKTATMQLLYSLVKVGVIFIKGNHDSISEFHSEFDIVYDGFRAIEKDAFFWGGKCTDIGFSGINGLVVYKKWLHFEDVIFKNSYYDEITGSFYIHNGLSYFETENDGAFVETAFGFFCLDDFASLKEFEAAVNSVKSEQISESSLKNGDFTGFRPYDEDTNSSGLFLHPLFKNVKLIHGHSEEFCIKDNGNIFNINSRLNREYFTAALCIGE